MYHPQCLNLHKNGHEVFCLDLNTELYKDLPEDIQPVSCAREMAEKTVAYMGSGRAPIEIEDAHHHVLLDQPLTMREALVTLLAELRRAP